jgi:hypothetical protein
MFKQWVLVCISNTNMKRLSIIFFLILTAVKVAGQDVEFVSSIEPTPLAFDSILFQEMSETYTNDLHKIGNDFILIAESSLINNAGSELYFKKDFSDYWYGFHLDWNHVKLDTVNLDRQGKAEILLNCEGCSYGKGGGSCEGAFIVINIDSIPMQLMNVIVYCRVEQFSRFYGNDTIPCEGFYEEYRRKISFNDNSITIYPNDVKRIRAFEDKVGGMSCGLTPIPSGQYKLIEGQLRKVKK